MLGLFFFEVVATVNRSLVDRGLLSPRKSLTYGSSRPFPSASWSCRSATPNALWRRDGKEIFYLSRATKLMAVKVREKNATLEIGDPQPLFQTNPPPSLWAGRTFDVTADGKKFIVVTRLPAPPSAEPVTLVVNWPALLKKQQ